jgi:tetratricopeptide (TPR) repeat protein
LEAQNNFDDKVNLIYECNSKSPLFLRKAFLELEKKNINGAIEILTAGIAEYPAYPAVRFLLARAYMTAGDYKEALEQIKTGSRLIRSKKTYNYYLTELNFFKQQNPQFELIDNLPVDESKDILKEKKSVENVTPFKPAKLASETLAKIYLAQGEILEAIKVYEILAEKEPEKRTYYLDTIKVLERRM